LELRFDDPTDFVQIIGDGFNDAPGFLAYDRDGNRLGTSFHSDAYVESVAQLSPGSFRTTLSLAREQRDIARVIYAGIDGSDTPTQITYRVPEPSTLLFVSMGALALVRYRRRRRFDGSGTRRLLAGVAR
jgi:hypothetical protein